MSKPQGLSPSQARKLSQWLKSDHCPPLTLNFHALKGFLFAVASGPAWVESQDWLPLVFGAKLEDCLSGDDSAQWIELIERLYRQIHHQVVSGQPKVPTSCRLIEPWQHNFEPTASVSQWCEGFLQGHMALVDWWEEYLAGDEELQEALGMAVIILGFYADREESEKLAKLAFGDDPDFQDLSMTMRSYMPNALHTYADIGQQLYQEHNHDQNIRVLQRDMKAYEAAGENVVSFPLASDHRDDIWHAQQLVYAAWEAKDTEQRVHYANEALELDPDCVDAYLVLANDASKSRGDVLQFLKSAVDAGERVLGEDLAQDQGHFWHLPETRPYMRARYSYAETLWELGKRDESIAHFLAVLELNPDDNQGVRYMLISHHIEMGNINEAAALLDRFEDHSALWLFSRALIAYIQYGDCSSSRAVKKKAVTANVHVIGFLTSQKHLPSELPDYYGLGDESEAVVYAWYNRKLWRQVEGAMDWLLGD